MTRHSHSGQMHGSIIVVRAWVGDFTDDEGPRVI